jgi:hypothetical protein
VNLMNMIVHEPKYKKIVDIVRVKDKCSQLDKVK